MGGVRQGAAGGRDAACTALASVYVRYPIVMHMALLQLLAFV
jgi:hypothetical protein